ncbi:hypothetical protein GCM10011383_12670 [Hymenobacter cavernae]|uniref:Fibronectin type-III domain-containing protein n=1 Tax=Hymenobacter cavernae TaxID=2044852 RepID=A0ABQ1TVJ5_9BACT|nr:hypothetical protein GCM10011383_12670 [Hymenobacter cavernae]
MSEPKVVGDSIKLQWTKLENANFMSYSVLRKTPSDSYQIPIAQNYRADQVSFVDNTVPYSATVEYQVIARISSNQPNQPNQAGQTISSNIISYQRKDIKTLAIAPYDVQFRPQDRLLYFFEKSGTISKYDVKSEQIVKSVNTAATIGYCDFGTYNGVEELYVPRNDGWIFIYDAATLAKVDQLNVGLSSSCVVAYNGLLFISTSAWTNRPLKVYNRATKQLISETGDFDQTRFKRFPNSATELLEITLNIGPTDQDYYSFNANGTSSYHVNDRYHGDYPLDANIFEFFPQGNKYITASAGAIYRKDMTYEASLPRGNKEFTTFCFDESAQLIYAGTRTKSLEVYTIASYNYMRSIATKAYPFKLFKDTNGGFLCVSSINPPASYYSPPSSGIIIEQVK